MYAHDELYERGERDDEEDGGEGDVVGEVDHLARLALELDLAVAQPVVADAAPRAVREALAAADAVHGRRRGGRRRGVCGGRVHAAEEEQAALHAAEEADLLAGAEAP